MADKYFLVLFLGIFLGGRGMGGVFSHLFCLGVRTGLLDVIYCR